MRASEPEIAALSLYAVQVAGLDADEVDTPIDVKLKHSFLLAQIEQAMLVRV